MASDIDILVTSPPEVVVETGHLLSHLSRFFTTKIT